MRSIKALMGVLIPFLLLLGCLNYEERIILKRDGSGQMKVHYYANKKMKTKGDFVIIAEDEEEIREEIEERYTSKRVRLSDFRVKDKDNKQHVYFTLDFKDIEDLNDLRQFKDSQIKLVRGIGRLSFQRSFQIGDEDWGKSDSALERMVKSILEDAVLQKIRFRFEVIMPGKIEESNADYLRGSNRAVWRFRLSDVMGKEEVKMYVRSKL